MPGVSSVSRKKKRWVSDLFQQMSPKLSRSAGSVAMFWLHHGMVFDLYNYFAYIDSQADEFNYHAFRVS